MVGSERLSDPFAQAHWRVVRRRLQDVGQRGVFWPAADTSEWRWDFADWIFNSPEESVDPAWIEDQMRRIEVGART